MRHLWLLCVVLGCGTGSDEPTGMKVQEGRAPAIALGAKAPAINALEPYERLVRAFDQCALEGNQIVSTCPAVALFEKEMTGVSPSIAAKVGAKLIGHASPAVRVQAASMVRADVLARAAGSERDPRVLEAYVRIAGRQARDPAAAALLATAAHHADAEVRLQTVQAIAAADVLVALAETDADPRVRRAACERAGKVGGIAVLPLYERATLHATDSEFYAACMEGLASMVTTNEPAYHLFLRRIAEVPRTAHTPPWTVMSVFCDLDTKPSYFDAAEVRRVFSSVIVDRDASMQARSAAIESLAHLEPTEAELVSLKKQLADKPLVDKLVAICESR